MSEFEYKDHYLKFFVSGIEEPFIFHVSAEESARASGLQGFPMEDETSRFFCFDTADGRSVAISLPDVELLHYLWDPLVIQPSEAKQEDDDEPPHELRLYFRDRAEPFVAMSSDPEDLAVLMLDLDGGHFGGQPFLSFRDEDDEEVAFNTKKLQLIVVPTSELREGHRMISDAQEL